MSSINQPHRNSIAAESAQNDEFVNVIIDQINNADRATINADNIASPTGRSTANNTLSVSSGRNKVQYQQPIIDLAVAMIAVPTLVIFGLLLEANTREQWMDSQANRFTVLGLGIGLAVITMLICGYVTHRLGVCLWTGPLALDESHVQNQTTNQHFSTLPPSYEAAMGFDIPPPPYHIVIKIFPSEAEGKFKDVPFIDQVPSIHHI